MTKSVGYIYPAWSWAKNALAEMVWRKGRNGEDPAQAIDEWFKTHCFELGVTLNVDREWNAHAAIDIEAEITHKAARMLAEEIFNLGLMSKTVTGELPGREDTTFRIVVFGVPMATGPAKRQPAMVSKE